MVQKNSKTHADDRGLVWRCRLARYDAAVSKVFGRSLIVPRDDGDAYAGSVPTDKTSQSNYPVIQFPNGTPEHGDLITVLFIREPRAHGEGERNVVRIYRLQDQNLRDGQNPEYVLSAAFLENVVAEKPADVRLQPESMIRFRTVGFGGIGNKNVAAIFVKRGVSQEIKAS